MDDLTQLDVALGPYRLGAQIGAGAMASVWAGVHEAQGVPVAVKILTSTLYLRPEFARAFENEVHAIARLHHPGVVMVLDSGVVGSAVASSADFIFPPASPYLVMELASGGTLLGTAGTWDWRALRSVLMALLSALSHAHARGVIHRDLKPSNVLLSTRRDIRPGVKLTDFGIADAGLREASSAVREAPFGTPYYMAPEQFEGAWRRYGPWTDLYGLGVLAWELATGTRPFLLDRNAKNPVLHLARAHSFEEPGDFRASRPVPAGFEGWLRRLLMKRPRERFQRAADAAWALRALGDDVEEVDAGGVPQDEDAGPTELLEEHPLLVDLTSSPRSEVPVVQEDLPPLPRRWRRSRDLPPLQLVGAGLELYGLRATPFVGRDFARERIWGALQRCRETGRAQVMVVRGSAGVGKSRLVEWMAQRADEVGNAVVLKAPHGPLPGPAHGLSRLLSRFFRTAGLAPEESFAHLEQVLVGYGIHEARMVRSLVELISPDVDSLDSADHQEIFAALARFVRRLGLERPVIVWLDDVQWGIRALSWLRLLLRQQVVMPSRVLVVCTVRDEALEAGGVAEDLLAGIAADPHTEVLQLEPLTVAETDNLVGELLGLDSDLRRTVVDRCAGNPLFATQLVGDWVQRGVLVVSGDGFGLAEGARADVPEDIQSLWASPLERVLDGLAPDARAALEIAAALGQNVEGEEWSRACLAAGVALPRDLVPRLVLRQLAIRGDGGFTFVHGLLRETLQAQAQAAGRWAAHSDACARMLLSTYHPGSAELEERLCALLYAAGREEEALVHVLATVAHASTAGQYKRCWTWLARFDDTVAKLGLDLSDPRVLEGAILRGDALNSAGRPGEAKQFGASIAEAARTYHHSAELLNRALRVCGFSAHQTGDLEGATAFFAQSLDAARREGLLVPMGFSLSALGNVARIQGKLEQAARLYEEAQLRFEQARRPAGAALARRLLAQVHRQRGDLDAAETLYREAAQWARGDGDLVTEARALNGLAEVYRAKGQIERARSHYEAALPALEEAVAGDAASIRLNLAMILLTTGDPVGARSLAERTLRDLLEGGQKIYAGFARSVLLPAAAATGDLQSAALQLDGIDQTLSVAGIVDTDVATCATMAGEELAGRDEALARRAFGLARAQWLGLSREVDAERVQAALDALGDPA